MSLAIHAGLELFGKDLEMRSLTLVTMLAAAVVAMPAQARDRTAYAGVEGGVLAARGLDVEFSTNVSLTADQKTGYDVGLVAGYDFGRVRVEAELAHKRAGHQGDYTFSYQNGSSTRIDAKGATSVTSLMANLLVDLGDDNGLNFSAGGGLGWARTKSKYDDGSDTFDIKDGGLAWQLIAAARYPVSRSLDIGFKYRYFHGGQVKDQFGDSSSSETRFRSHSLLVSLHYNFGATAPVVARFAPPPLPSASAPM